MELLIAIVAIIVAIVVPVALYRAGVRQGRRQEQKRHEHELQMAREQRGHERALEADRQRRELISKAADEYVDMARRRHDSGPHALATLGLEYLGSDEAIREAIDQMGIRTSRNPWGSDGQHIQDIDLVAFFRHVREARVDFFKHSVEAVAAKVRAQGNVRSVTSTTRGAETHANQPTRSDHRV